MKKVYTLFVLLAFCSFALGQNVKTYKGKMSKRPVSRVDFGLNLGMSLEPEIWSYEYYEDEDGSRIYHGKLSYSLQYGRNSFYTIKGQYSHGKKEGIWEYKALENGNKLYGKWTVNYHNDLLDGDYDYYAKIGGTFGESIKMIGKFSQGHPIGKMVCSMSESKRNISYEANYSEDGYPDGVWTCDVQASIARKTKIRFLNNCLISKTTIDQSTGEKNVTKSTDIAPEEYEGGSSVLIPESIAKVLSAKNRKFNGARNNCYQLVDGWHSDFSNALQATDYIEECECFELIDKLYGQFGSRARYLKIVPDEARNEEVRDSIEEVKRIEREQSRLAAEKAKQLEKQKEEEAQLAHQQAIQENNKLAEKIRSNFANNKEARKWENLNSLFNLTSRHHSDYEDTPQNLLFLNKFYICVYRIINSEIESKYRKEYEKAISSDVSQAISASCRAGGWRYYCEPDEILKKCMNMADGLQLIKYEDIAN